MLVFIDNYGVLQTVPDRLGPSTPIGTLSSIALAVSLHGGYLSIAMGHNLDVYGVIGNKFVKTSSLPMPPAEPTEWIKAMTFDPHGRLWVSYNKGTLVFQNGAFKSVTTATKNAEVSESLLYVHDDYLFLGTQSELKIFRINYTGYTLVDVTRLKHKDLWPSCMCIVDGTAKVVFTTFESPSGKFVASLVEFNISNLATASIAAPPSNTSVDLATTQVTGIAALPSGQLVLGQYTGVVYQGATNHVTPAPDHARCLHYIPD